MKELYEIIYKDTFRPKTLWTCVWILLGFSMLSLRLWKTSLKYLTSWTWNITQQSNLTGEAELCFILVSLSNPAKSFFVFCFFKYGLHMLGIYTPRTSFPLTTSLCGIVTSSMGSWTEVLSSSLIIHQIITDPRPLWVLRVLNIANTPFSLQNAIKDNWNV